MREIDIDKIWTNKSTEAVQRKQEVEQYAELTTFWNQLPGKEGFKDVLLKTTSLPKFWKPEFCATGATLKSIRAQLK
jgi:hypothetical protein